MKKTYIIYFKKPLERIQYAYAAKAENKEEAAEAIKFLFPNAIIIKIELDQ